jgi:cell division septation protein DedD
MPDRIEMEVNERLPSSHRAARPPWGRRILTLLVAFAAIGGFAMVVVYSYQGGDNEAGKDAPVIAAYSGPTKVRPESPGGMPVPNQDKQIYGQIDSARMPETIERLLPPPERIVTQPPPAPATAMPAVPPPAAARDLAAIEPAAGNAETTPPAAPKPEPAAKAPVSAPAVAEPAAPPSPPPATPKKTASVAKQAAPAAPPLSSGWRIQIASLQSEAAAKTAWGRLTEKNGDLFGKLRHQIVRIDIAGKGTFYRVQAGPLANAEEATSLCSRVKQRKIGCLVVRP